MPEERDIIESAVARMFAGFRAMRSDADPEATTRITLHALREFPAWAIQEGCRRVSCDEAGLDVRYPPNDAELCRICRKVVEPYQARLRNANELLSAPVEAPEPPRPTRAAIEAIGRPVGELRVDERRQLRLPGDGKHWQRIAAELEARKARNAELTARNAEPSDSL
jgi:hypothetical protein